MKRRGLRYASSIPSRRETVGELMREVLELLQERGWEEEERVSVQMALNEAVYNAIVHGNREDEAKRVQVALSLEVRARKRPEGASSRGKGKSKGSIWAQKLVIVVRDEGKGFDHSNLPDPKSPENILKEKGRGIYMMRHLMDEVSFNDVGNEIKMVKYLAR